jgi:zinc protease
LKFIPLASSPAWPVIAALGLFTSLLTPPASAAPAGGTADVLRRVLPNGLTVLAEARPTAPVVTVMMWYRVGSRDEVPGQTGIAHFIEHLMFKGTPTLAKGEIDRLTMKAGGTNNAFTGTDYTAYVFNLPADRWQVALGIEADRMRHSRFVGHEFESERQVVMEERRSGEDDPGDRLREQVNGIAFMAHPYRNPVVGWMSDLKRLTRDQILAFYQHYYVPANATCVIVGDIDPAGAVAAARRAFSTLPRLTAPPRPRVQEPPQAGERRVTVRLEAQSPRLEVQFHTPRRGHPHQPPLDLLVQALVGGKSSRLYQRLVEGEQLATAIDGDAGDALDPDTTHFSVVLKPGASLERAEAGLLDELRRVSHEPLTREELTRARNQLETAFVEGEDTAQERASALGEAASLTGLAYLDHYLPHLAAVTPEQARQVATLYLRDTNRTVGWLVPKNASSPTEVSQHGKNAARRSRRAGRRGSAPLLMETRAPIRLCTRTRAPHPVRPSSVPFRRLPVVRRVLPNGLTVLLLENHTEPLFTAEAMVRAGSRDEPEAKAGLAHFTAVMLDDGTPTRNELEIARTLETMGVSLDASVASAETTVRVEGLSRALRPSLEVWADVLRRPTFPEDRATAERERALADIRATADDPGQVAAHAFHDLVYGSHPAHRPVEGYEQTVARLTRSDLAEFHQAHYLPNQTVLVLVGDFRARDALALIERLFGDWERRSAPATSVTPPVRQTDRRERRVTLAKEQAQVLLGHLGIPRKNPDYVPLEVLDMVLGTGAGGTFTARIPQQLRDVQGLAYTVGASITASAGVDPGVFLASMGVQPRNTSRAVAGLLREIRRIRERPVTPQELADAVAYLTGSYVFDFETNDQLVAYLLEVEQFGLGIDYRQRYPALVRAVTAADLQRAARRYLDPDHYTLVIVGPGASGKVDRRTTKDTAAVRNGTDGDR